jgi:hypothetical protein
MNTRQSNRERLVEMDTILAATIEVLAGLVIKLQSATAEEIPALVNQAKSSVEQIVKCCTGTAALEHLSPEIAETMLADLISLGETLQAQIAASASGLTPGLCPVPGLGVVSSCDITSTWVTRWRGDVMSLGRLLGQRPALTVQIAVLP